MTSKFYRTWRGWAVLVVAFFFAGNEAAAQDAGADSEERAVEFSFTGAIQPRLTYGVEQGPEGDFERVGLGLRRGRAEANITVGDHMGINYDIDFGGGSGRTVDLFAFYQPSDFLRVRFGLFAQAQPRSYILTSFSRIDTIDRASIAERWARATIGSSGRDFGLEATLSWTATQLMLALHNGDGSFSEGNFRQRVAPLSGDRTRDIRSLAYSLYVNHELVSGLEIGGLLSYNGSRNANTTDGLVDTGRSYVSWSTHAYWGADPGSQPIRLKLDVIGLHFEDETLAPGAVPQHTIGVAATGVVRIFRYGELYARFEQEYVEDEPDNQFLAAGLSYSLSAARGEQYRMRRITLGYQGGYAGVASDVDHHAVVIQLQVAF